MRSYIKYLLPWIFNVLYFYRHKTELQEYATLSRLKIRAPTFEEFREQMEFKEKLKRNARRHLRLVE